MNNEYFWWKFILLLEPLHSSVQIINNKEAPWITLSKQHLAHDSQLEQQSLRLLRVVVVWFSADTFQLLTKESKEKKKKTCMRGARQQGLGKEETASTACKFRKSRSTLTSLLYETYLASRLTYFSKSSCSDKLLWVVTTNLSIVDQHTVAQPNF